MGLLFIDLKLNINFVIYSKCGLEHTELIWVAEWVIYTKDVPGFVHYTRAQFVLCNLCSLWMYETIYKHLCDWFRCLYFQ